jgi:hypothetical protein
MTRSAMWDSRDDGRLSFSEAGQDAVLGQLSVAFGLSGSAIWQLGNYVYKFTLTPNQPWANP